MRMICIDDEELVLELIVSLCRELPQNPEVKGFSRTAQALEFLEGNSVSDRSQGRRYCGNCFNARRSGPFQGHRGLF